MVYSIFLPASYLDSPRGGNCIFFPAMVLFTILVGNSTGWRNYSAPFSRGHIHRAGFFYMYLCLSFQPEIVYLHIWGTYTSPFAKKKIPPDMPGSVLNPSFTKKTQIPNISKVIRKIPWSASHFGIPGMQRVKVGYPTTEHGLFTGQPRKFKYRKADIIESTTRQDSTGPSCSCTLCLVYSTYDLLCFIYINK
jgi:hypothetical protein